MPKKKNLYIWRPIIKIKALQEILFMAIKNGCVPSFLLPLLKNIYYHTLNINCGRTFVSAPNQVLFTLGQARIDLRPTRTNLLNPILGRDASHPCLISLWPKERCTTTTHAPNQVLFALEWVRIELRPTRTNLLNPTSRRDASTMFLFLQLN